MLKKVSSKFLLVGTLGLTMIAPTVAFADYQGYQAYALYSFQRDNYTNTHDKETNEDYIKNHVITLTDTDKAIFWAAKPDNTKISNNYTQNQGNTTNINFKSGFNLSQNDQVKMGLKNAHLKTSNAFVTGEVDFK
ncbi:hypothetical protein Sgly_0106 [Syntrophobotulus glycolicus DSM 8271]|uniref:Immunodominant antigen B n=1 Tax=Syntrophobotulus glycolicus (strain DSM 8271 / FlGlyR) TaxID=645991 RepID=F0SVK1_SYNGF|nr:hypothetical protein [Syntrophobotulus glycolicus]ADY54477.1 hypothetical protein Sgly_0106 [Syntrophobotulus glycolicus DSM 8271]